MTDLTGKKCKECGKGTYQETGFHDDMDGVLHCNKCGSEIKRHNATQEEEQEIAKMKKETKIKRINKEIENLKDEIKRLERSKNDA